MVSQRDQVTESESNLVAESGRVSWLNRKGQVTEFGNSRVLYYESNRMIDFGNSLGGRDGEVK